MPSTYLSPRHSLRVYSDLGNWDTTHSSNSRPLRSLSVRSSVWFDLLFDSDWGEDSDVVIASVAVVSVVVEEGSLRSTTIPDMIATMPIVIRRYPICFISVVM